jgi:hypothetical protein
MFNRRADHNPSVTAWDQVDIWGTQNARKLRAGRLCDNQHLAFAWNDFGRRVQRIGPGAAAVDKCSSAHCAANCGQQDLLAFGPDRHHAFMLAEYDPGSKGRGAESNAEFAGVKASLLQQQIAMVRISKAGYESKCLVMRKGHARSDYSLRAQNLHGLLRAKGNMLSGKFLYCLEKLLVNTTAITRKRKQSGGIFRVIDGKHAARRPGGFLRRLTRFEYRDLEASPPQS